MSLDEKEKLEKRLGTLARLKWARGIAKELPGVEIDVKRLADPNDAYPFDAESLKFEKDLSEK